MVSASLDYSNGPDANVQRLYAEERNKRLRQDGVDQFIDLKDAERFKDAQDPWADHEALDAGEPPLKDGSEYKFFILGCGYGALLYAVRLIEAGFRAEDIRMVDSAGGFGGTWYWNRYPGLMCDVESYIYMPLLEETGYIPQHKYAYGSELREHAERIAARWNLTDKALFRSTVETLEWDDDQKRWAIHLGERRGPNKDKNAMTIRCQFAILASGPLDVPHIPKLPGLDDFQGPIFHTSRWDYNCTGGSQSDPRLINLQNKRVGIIGTGATAVQVVPELSKWAQELFVFQRTPSVCGFRNQRKTNLEEWKCKIASKEGWQRERELNFSTLLTDKPASENLVDDEWCKMRFLCAMAGGYREGVLPSDQVDQYIAKLHQMEFPYAQKVRDRVDSVVENKDMASKLKAWYPAWCKRPTFHDDYLPTFNKPNVHLVDTDGRGVDCLTRDGVNANGEHFDIDVLVLSTGYRAPVAGSNSPAFRAGITIKGRDGKSMDDKWIENGATAMHGIATHDFPNLFFSGFSQAGSTPNFITMIDLSARQVTYIIETATRKAGHANFAVEPTREAEEEWSTAVADRASYFAALPACTPGYYTLEGAVAKLDPEAQRKLARSSPWGEGFVSYKNILDAWMVDNNLDGFKVID